MQPTEVIHPNALVSRSCSRSDSPNRLIVATTFISRAAKQAARTFRWCADPQNPPEKNAIIKTG